MQELVNGELTITLPEGFRAMTAEEMQKGFAGTMPNAVGFRDEANHVIAIVAWNETNRFLVKLASPKSLTKRAEMTLPRLYKDHDYHFDGRFTSKLAGIEAHGIRYGFTTQGIAHDAETVMIPKGKRCYSLYYYTRSECAAANVALHDKIFASLAFK